MLSPYLRELPYPIDLENWAYLLAQEPGFHWLDSGQTGGWHILTSTPKHQEKIAEKTIGYDNLLRFLRTIDQVQSQYCNERLPAHLPFRGGAIGCIRYETGYCLNHLTTPEPIDPIPFAQANFYDWAVLCHPPTRQAWLTGQSNHATATLDQRHRILSELAKEAPCSRAPFRLTDSMTPSLDLERYTQQFARLQRYIQAGDIYQANLTIRFDSHFEGTPFAGYQRLRHAADAPFSAYLALDDQHHLLCASPERFLQVQGQRVATAPIKGTTKRSSRPHRDQQLAHALQNSSKNRAENVMIVDLLRNDLGRVCKDHSVHVPELLQIHSFKTVHHLISTICGELKTGHGIVDLLLASLPGGSITGAPKRRAMEVIAELEPHERNLYCGNVFVWSGDHFDSNIVIRSALTAGDKISLWGGGGVVADSRPHSEWREIGNKIGRLIDALKE